MLGATCSSEKPGNEACTTDRSLRSLTITVILATYAPGIDGWTFSGKPPAVVRFHRGTECPIAYRLLPQRVSAERDVAFLDLPIVHIEGRKQQ